MNKQLAQSSKDYSRIEQAIHFLEENFDAQPDLKEVARKVGMSEYHFQRVFRRWSGISPKKFVQFLTKEHAKKLLEKSNLLNTSLDAGLSGPSRLHDLFVGCEAMSPGEFKQRGEGLTIIYGFHPSPFGECFIAMTDRGICGLSFLDKTDRKKVLAAFQRDWKNAQIDRDQRRTGKCVEQIFPPRTAGFKKNVLKLLYGGTNFQMKVWEALLRIPSGGAVTYQTVARSIGHPKAVRAVGTAVGKNPIAYLIPCHRVIRAMGQLGGYRWGISRKKAILAKEASIHTRNNF